MALSILQGCCPDKKTDIVQNHMEAFWACSRVTRAGDSAVILLVNYIKIVRRL